MFFLYSGHGSAMAFAGMLKMWLGCWDLNTRSYRDCKCMDSGSDNQTDWAKCFLLSCPLIIVNTIDVLICLSKINQHIFWFIRGQKPKQKSLNKFDE